MVQRDKARGVATDDPVVEQLAKASPKHSVFWMIKNMFSCFQVSWDFSGYHYFGLQFISCSIPMNISSKAEATYKILFKNKLGLGVPISKNTFGGVEDYEWLRPSDFVAYMDRTRNLDKLLGVGSLPEIGDALELFWQRYQLVCPGHEVFEASRKGHLILRQTVPIYLHADEGRTLKKKAVFLIQFQPAFGKGVGQKNSPEEIQRRLNELNLQPNFKGHSFTTRFLAGLMLRKTYAEDPEALTDLLEYICTDLQMLAQEGLLLRDNTRLWMATLGNKGDWSYLAQVAGLTRSYKNAPKRQSSQAPDKGMCHLCYAGMAGYPYEDVSLNSLG